MIKVRTDSNTKQGKIIKLNKEISEFCIEDVHIGK
jgi:hypothetical protein